MGSLVPSNPIPSTILHSDRSTLLILFAPGSQGLCVLFLLPRILSPDAFLAPF